MKTRREEIYVLLRFQVQEEKSLTIHNSVATEKYRSWKLPLFFSIKMLSSLLTIVMGQTIQKHICKAKRELFFHVVLFPKTQVNKEEHIYYNLKGQGLHSTPLSHLETRMILLRASLH